MIEKLLATARYMDNHGMHRKADMIDRLAFSNNNGEFIIKIISEQQVNKPNLPKYLLRNEKIKFSNDSMNVPGHEFIDMINAYTMDGNYIGNKDDAVHIVEKFGIKPEKRHPDHCVCTIGLSEKDGKFYGWSHRAIHGFGINDDFYEETLEDDCNGVKKAPDSDESWSISQGLAQKKRRKIQTLEEARQSACNFAESVS